MDNSLLPYILLQKSRRGIANVIATLPPRISGDFNASIGSSVESVKSVPLVN